ncbi:MAG TPA: argininosuccinate lyase [Gemmatimonadales bacterium]|nr:argininosuccinate lyase [Gemmatimonadales bacterium]
MTRPDTLWSPGADPDAQMLAYTVGDDREVDARLLRWDVLGSLGHIEALRGGGIISTSEHGGLRLALRAALQAVESGALVIEPTHEDVHSAVESWLTRQFGDAGERLHAGRSRNDQVATDLRLYLKDAVLQLHAGMMALAQELLAFAQSHQRVVWPGYTHQRIAMPSSAGLWAAGYAELLLDTAEAVQGIWPRIDRSPLGTAAGYGVPLPLDRERAARALGFAGIDQMVTSVQAARGQIEAATLFWCAEAAHACAKLSSDVILYTSDEFGWLILPEALSTGSSIMPQKRNPDLFELTRARAAALEGDLAAVMAIKRGLPGGYHRDFQLLKAPLFRGMDRTREMLAMLSTAIPQLGVNSVKAGGALLPEVFATDEAMRRVREGEPFRRAYRDVAAAVKRGDDIPVLTAAEVAAARTSTGGLGNLGLPTLRARLRDLTRWNVREWRRHDTAMARLAGTSRAR